MDTAVDRKLAWMIALGLLVPLLAAGCGSGSPAGSPAGAPANAPENPTRAQSSGSGNPVVTLLIYSGRQNPTFELAPAAAEALGSLLDTAERLDSYENNTVMPSILGYNGFLVENLSGEGPLPRQLVVYRGAVEHRNGETRFSRDARRSIERFLLEQMLAAGVIDARDLGPVTEAVGLPEQAAPPTTEGDAPKD